MTNSPLKPQKFQIIFKIFFILPSWIPTYDSTCYSLKDIPISNWCYLCLKVYHTKECRIMFLLHMYLSLYVLEEKTGSHTKEINRDLGKINAIWEHLSTRLYGYNNKTSSAPLNQAFKVLRWYWTWHFISEIEPSSMFQKWFICDNTFEGIMII